MRPQHGYQQPGMPQPGMGQIPMQGGMPMQGMPMQQAGGQVINPYTGQVAEGMIGQDPGLLTVQQIFDKLKHGIFIKQKFELLEALTGCETANTYNVFQLGSDGAGNPANQVPLFKCKEKSSCCARLCMSGADRPFDMYISKCVANAAFQTDDACIIFRKPCKMCVTPCCNRPVIKVYMKERPTDEEVYIGKVIDNCDCANFSFNIYDENDNKKFFIKAGCCQLGFWCKCPCEACERIVFKVNVTDQDSEEQPLVKKGAGSCLKNAFGDADFFSCPFPSSANFKDKILFMATCIMIDYTMFEEKGGAKNKISPA